MIHERDCCGFMKKTIIGDKKWCYDCVNTETKKNKAKTEDQLLKIQKNESKK